MRHSSEPPEPLGPRTKMLVASTPKLLARPCSTLLMFSTQVTQPVSPTTATLMCWMLKCIKVAWSKIPRQLSRICSQPTMGLPAGVDAHGSLGILPNLAHCPDIQGPEGLVEPLVGFFHCVSIRLHHSSKGPCEACLPSVCGRLRAEIARPQALEVWPETSIPPRPAFS